MCKNGIIIIGCLIFIVSIILFAGHLYGQENEVKAVEFSVGTKVYYCYLSGDILVTAGGEPNTGTRIDFDDDMGLEDTVSFKPFIEMELNDKHLFYFSFMPLRFAGDKVFPDTEIFRNVTYPSGNAVKSRLAIDVYDLKYSYKIIKKDRVAWSLNLAGHYYNIDTKLVGTSTTGSRITSNRRLTPFFPTIGTGIVYSLSSRWSADLAVEGIILSNDQSYIGVEGKLEYLINDNISLNTGILFCNVNFARSSNNGKLVTTMPFIGGEIRF